MAKGTYFYGLGRRKSASATARLYEGKGEITINGKPAIEFGQVDAARLAIAKALASINDDLRATLSKAGYLRRDSREVERKKYGLKGARRKEQFSKR